ncbi:glycosyltransferase family 4 protein [Roseivivax isoporae]|uniref:glycosyltransferase family 4 protein n=1 Tax=Roseivivax isoporae TaxID=591206 RepID=UPI0004B03634|nr:glycosyltransferase family 1 protein [Roseivivax isoporae]
MSRAGRTPTGVDRVETAYLARFLSDDVPLFGLVRTSLGYLLLDGAGARAVLDSAERGWGRAGPLAHLLRQNDPARAAAETRLRRLALGRALPGRLGALLRRRLPDGTCYVNVGHANLDAHTWKGLGQVPGLRAAVMLHDTIPLDWPDFQRPGTPERFATLFRGVMDTADLVIANSRVTADDITRHAGTNLPEIVVAPLGVARPRAGPPPEGPWTGTPYFVSLGTIEPRKNHTFLLDIWDHLGAGAPHLLIVGTRGWENHETFARLDARPQRVHELNGLSDAQVFGLLAASAGLLFPSRAEGYGLPLVEAAALGVPVLCNDLAVFREIGGDFPIYATIGDHYSWASTVRRLARDADARQDRQGNSSSGRRIPRDPPAWDDHFALVLPRL